MSNYIAADGTVLSDELVAELAREAEEGFPHSELTRSEPNPWRQREPMETHSIRIPAQLWSLLEQHAAKQHITTSEYTRRALAQSLLVN